MFGWRRQTQPGLVLNNPYLGFEGAPDVTVWKLLKSTFMASMAYSTWKSLPSGENVFTPLQGQHRQSEKGRKAMECKSLLRGEGGAAGTCPLQHRTSPGSGFGMFMDRNTSKVGRSGWDAPARCGCWKPLECKGPTRSHRSIVLPWNP